MPAASPGRAPCGRPSSACCALGTPRTDAFFDAAAMAAARARVLAAHPGLAGRRVVLWAPTFRGRGRDRTGAHGRSTASGCVPCCRPMDGSSPSRRTPTWTRPSSPPPASTSSGGRTRTSTTGSRRPTCCSPTTPRRSSSGRCSGGRWCCWWTISRRTPADPGLYLDYGTEMIGHAGARHRRRGGGDRAGRPWTSAAWDAFIARNMGAATAGPSERFVERFLPAPADARDR